MRGFGCVVSKNNKMEFPVIDIEHISKHYVVDGTAIPAITDINLRIEQGEIFGIIGASGAGKSTLIRTLNLLERPDSGRILVDGTDITTLSKAELQAYRRKAGMIFQHFNLIGAKTVGDNIRFPLKLTGEYSDVEMDARVGELLESVGKRFHDHFVIPSISRRGGVREKAK